MSERLELTGEQARILREWWLVREKYLYNSPPIGDHAVSEANLRQALRPLFEPWRVVAAGSFGPKHRVVKHGPDGLEEVRIECFGPGPEKYLPLAQRVCDLLNAAERGEDR